jgi:hypothetical protein
MHFLPIRFLGEEAVTRKEAVRAIVLLSKTAPYGAHLESCSSRRSFGDPASDYCNCGLAGAKAAYQELYELLDKRGGVEVDKKDQDALIVKSVRWGIKFAEEAAAASASSSVLSQFSEETLITMVRNNLQVVWDGN